MLDLGPLTLTLPATLRVVTHLHCNFDIPSVTDLANGYFLADHLHSLTIEELACFLEKVETGGEELARRWAELDGEVEVRTCSARLTLVCPDGNMLVIVSGA